MIVRWTGVTTALELPIWHIAFWLTIVVCLPAIRNFRHFLVTSWLLFETLVVNKFSYTSWEIEGEEVQEFIEAYAEAELEKIEEEMKSSRR